MALAALAAALLLGGASDTNLDSGTADDGAARYYALPQTAPANDALRPLPAQPEPDQPGTGAPAAAPHVVSLPTIQTQSELLQLGLEPDGTLEVPPADPGSPAGWYSGSPSPGETGPAVLLGHVNDTEGGPGVFARLRALQPGDQITIERQDGTTAAFTVVKGEQYAKDNFPTDKVYGNTPGPELRLITCDGLDRATGLWQDNYVVYAVLSDLQ